MIKSIIIICISVFSFSAFSQESFKKRYRIRAFFNFPIHNQDIKGKDTTVVGNETNNVFLKKDCYESYLLLNENVEIEKKQRDEIDKKIERVAKGFFYGTELYDIEGNKFTITKEQAINPELKNIIGYNKTEIPDFFVECSSCIFKGNVLFEKDKIYVNVWNFIYDSDEKKYTDDTSELYYQLSDGQTAKLYFYEWTATALTIPLKYRPEDGNNEAIDNVFSTSFNAGLFIGPSIGRTKFHHRKKVGNKSITEKLSLGGFIGSASETLTEKNTGAGGLTGEDSQTIGLLSSGMGIIYSRNKLSVGFFMGWDHGIGSLSKSWHYDGLLWIGAGLGYDIFKL